MQAGHAALAGLGHVEVLEVLGLVDDEQVEAELVPGDAGVVLPAGGDLELLGDPGGHALLQDGGLPLGDLLAAARVPLPQGDLAADRLGVVGVAAQGGLVHAGAAERGVGQQDDVELPSLEGSPLRGALLRGVGLGGDLALAVAAGHHLPARADHGHPVVRQHAAHVRLPLPGDGVRHEDDRATDPALLPGAWIPSSG